MTEPILPSWIVETIAEWMAQKRTGALRLNFANGMVRNVNVEWLMSPPVDGKCRNCRQAMERRSDGWYCGCGSVYPL